MKDFLIIEKEYENFKKSHEQIWQYMNSDECTNMDEYHTLSKQYDDMSIERQELYGKLLRECNRFCNELKGIPYGYYKVEY